MSALSINIGNHNNHKYALGVHSHTYVPIDIIMFSTMVVVAMFVSILTLKYVLCIQNRCMVADDGFYYKIFGRALVLS